MPPALQQDIRVTIETVLKGNPQFAVFTQNVEKVKGLDGKKIELGNATNAQQLAASIDKLATAVDKLDDAKVGRLGKAFHFLGTAAQILGHLKGAKEGIEVIRDVINTSPNLANFAGKLSATANSIGTFFSALKEKAVTGLSALKEKAATALGSVKTKVTEVVGALPRLITGLGETGTGLLGVGAAGAVAVGGLIAVAGAIALIVAAAVAMPVIIHKLIELTVAASDAGSKLHDLSSNTGISVETLSALSVAAAESDKSIDDLASGVQKFNKLIGEAAGGSKEAKQQLKLFGIEPQEALKNQEAALDKVLKKIIETPPGIQRTILAQKAFGKAGADLTETLLSTGGSIEELKKKSQQLGQFWTTQAARQADEFGDHITDLKLFIEGLALTIGQVLIPELLRALRAISAFISTLREDGGTAAKVFAVGLAFIASQAKVATESILVLLAALKTMNQLGAAGPAAIIAGFELFKKNLAELRKAADTEPTGGGSTTTDIDLEPTGGGGSKKKSNPADTFDSTFTFNQRAADSALTLLKDTLERQRKAVKESFDKRKISISEFYDEEYKLQKRALDFEIESTKKAIVAQKERLAHKVERINKDDSLDAAEKAAQIEIETRNTEGEIVGLNEKLILLMRDRQELGENISKAETDAQRALQDSLQPILDQIDRANGKGALVDSREQISKLNEKIEELRANGQNAAADMVEEFTEFLNVLAQVNVRIDEFQRSQSVNEAKIQTLREQGQRNVIAQFFAERQINEIRRQQIEAAEKLLQELERVAAESKDPAVLVAIEQQRTAIARLKNEYTTLGRTIKDTFINSVTQGFEDFLLSIGDVITGTKSLKDAFKQFALSVIQELERVIAKMIAVKVIAAIIGAIGGGGGAGGGPGGGVVPIFGSALGGEFSAQPGGRVIQVAEAGHDELVVTTDPRHSRRTATLLGRFIKRTGILPDFSAGSPSRGILSNIAGRISSFAAGDFVSAPIAGAGAGGFGPISLTIQNVFPNVSDARGFNLNQQAIVREAGRAIEKGLRRAGRTE